MYENEAEVSRIESNYRYFNASSPYKDDTTPAKERYYFTPEHTNWKISQIPAFFQKRLDQRQKRLNQAD